VSDRHEEDRENVRFRVLRLLESDSNMSQRDIATALGVSLGGVNYCLRALVKKGHVKISNFKASNNKARHAYILTPSGIYEKTNLARRFLGRKMKEYDHIKSDIDSILQEYGIDYRI
jgi:EPS-associated MarR family transcriptional regulator